MPEYLDREALLDSICHETCGMSFCGATNCAFMAKVSSAPVADVAPVVRCKVCRSYNKPGVGWCEVHLDREHPDDFCSYGKYQTNGGADNA